MVVSVWCMEFYGGTAIVGGGQLGFDLNFAKFRHDEGLFIGLFVLIPLEGFGSWCGLLLQGARWMKVDGLVWAVR
jgi:hypothetical protein